MLAELFQPDLLLIIENGSIADYFDYFGALFNRQEAFGTVYEDAPFVGKYTPDRHSGNMKVRGFPMDGDSWVELQNWIDTSFTLAKPVTLGTSLLAAGTLSAADAVYFLAGAGIYKRPQAASANVTSLIASDGTVLATGLITDAAWEDSYNALLVPYERLHAAVGTVPVRYIKNLLQFGETAGHFRTSTLLFNGTGY